MKLPKTVTQTLFLHLEGEELSLHKYDMRECGYVLLGPVDVTVDVPHVTDAEITNKKIDYLRQGRQKVTEEFSTKLANIDEQINELLALPNLKVV